MCVTAYDILHIYRKWIVKDETKIQNYSQGEENLIDEMIHLSNYSHTENYCACSVLDMSDVIKKHLRDIKVLAVKQQL